MVKVSVEKNLDKKKIVRTITGWWEDWKLARQSKETVWMECIQNYMLYLDKSKYVKYPWKCSIAGTTTQETVDSIVSAITNALFPINEDFFEVEGLDDTGKEFAGQVAEELKLILYRTRFTSRCRPFIRQLCIIGNSTAGLYWRKRSSHSIRWQDGIRIPYERGATPASGAIEHCEFEPHNMFDVVYDPNQAEYSERVTRIHRIKTTLAELKLENDLQGNYENLSHLEKISGAGSASFEPSDAQEQEIRGIGGVDIANLKRSGEVDLLVVTGDFIIDGRKYEDYIAIIANKSVLIRFEPSPYWSGNPHIFGHYSDILVNEMLGRGPAETIKGIHSLVDTFTNQKADIINLILGGFLVVGKDTVMNPENIITHPFGIIQADDVSQVRSLAPTSNPTLSHMEIQNLQERAEKSTGASKFTRGAVPTGRRTAAETYQIAAGSGSRFNDVIMHIGEMAIEPALNIILSQEIQFNAYQGHLPDIAYEGIYRVKFNGAKNSVVRETAIQMLSGFNQAIGNNPIYSQFINPLAVIDEWMKALNITRRDMILQEPIGRSLPEFAPGQAGSTEDADTGFREVDKQIPTLPPLGD